MYVTGDDALSVVPELSTIYSEPFADSSQIPTFLLSKLTREHVTVALSGDGGDELFAGYNRYQICASIWKRLSYIPSPRLTLQEISPVSHRQSQEQPRELLRRESRS